MDAVHIKAIVLQLVYTVFIKPPLHYLHSLLPAKQEIMHRPLAELAGREKDKPKCSHFDGGSRGNILPAPQQDNWH